MTLPPYSQKKKQKGKRTPKISKESIKKEEKITLENWHFNVINDLKKIDKILIKDTYFGNFQIINLILKG